MTTDWRARIVRRFGLEAAPWLHGLSEREAQLAGAWALDLGAPFASGSTSRVVAVTRADGTPAVLKLSPDPELIDAEARALEAWAATGAVPALLERADDALLLERVLPGQRLADLPQPIALDRIAARIGALHVEAPAGFPPLADRLRFVYALAARRGPDPALVRRGLAAALELDASYADPPRLLHGDLHAGNVLDGGARGPIVIDPRPCVGDPAFDLVDWVLYDGDPLERVAVLAAGTGVDAQRLAAWARATAVLTGPALIRRSS